MNRREFVTTGLALSLSGMAFLRAGTALAAGQKTITFIPQADLTLVDPVQSTGIVTRNHGMMVFDQLYGLDENFEVQPQMVDTTEISDDGLTWTVTLRPGMTFHDGAPVTANDAVVSVKRWWAGGNSLGLDLQNATETLDATSELTMVFKLKTPFPMLSTALAMPSSFCAIMPARLADVPASQAIAEVIGSGPFRFIPEERIVGAQVVYEKYEGYVPRESGEPSFTAGPKVAMVDRVVWKAMPDAATASAAMQVGEADWWERPSPDLLPLLLTDPGIVVEAIDPTGYIPMLRLNHLTPPFNNPGVRRAILPAIDQAAYMVAVMGRDESFWRRDVGWFHPNSPYASDEGCEALFAEPDYDAAKRLLDEAGYDNEPVVMLVATDMHALNAQSLVAADMFQKMGMNVDYQAADWGTVLPRLSSRKSIEEDGWSMFANFYPGVLALNPATHSYTRGIGERGTLGWPASDEIEEIRDAFMAAPTMDEQKTLARRLQAQYAIDIPYVPTGFYMQPSAYRGLSGIRRGHPMFFDVDKA